jgi:hypothetical protein
MTPNLTVIVKVQMPLVLTESKPKALIYNKDRTINHWAYVEDIQDLMGARVKAFFYAQVLPGGKLQLYQPAPWQSW